MLWREAAVALLLLFMARGQNPQCGAEVPEDERVACWQFWADDITPDGCLARACCWNDTGVADPVLRCFMPSPSKVAISKVMVVQGSHFDAGFADTIDAIVGGRWFSQFFPDAAVTGAALEGLTNTTARLRWMAQSWLAWLYASDCPPNAGIPCPTPQDLATFQKSVSNEWITWHAVPFNAETSLMTSGALQAAINLTHYMDDALKVPRKRVMSLRDVPFLPRSALQHLNTVGVHTVSVGVNGGSRPPNLPKVFVWDDLSTGASVRVLLLQGGYGGLHLFGVFDSIVVPGLDTALVVDWAGDNSPPESPQGLMADFESLGNQFPGAQVVAGTFEDFAALMDGVPGLDSMLPHVTSEVGETWIFGAGADPIRTAKMRGAFRALSKCTATGECNLATDPVVRNTTGWLVRGTEHTDGLDVKTTLGVPGMHFNYSNAEFHAIVRGEGDPDTVARYQRLATSWSRQRAWSMDFGLQAAEAGPLGREHPLAQGIREEWAAITPLPPSTQGAMFIPPSRVNESSWVLGSEGRFWVLGVNSSTGAVSQLATAPGRTWVNQSSPGKELVALEYMTLSYEDFEDYEILYNYISALNLVLGPVMGGDDFNDQTLYGIQWAGAQHAVFQPRLTGVWVFPANSTVDGSPLVSRLVLTMQMPPTPVQLAGAFVQFNVIIEPGVDCPTSCLNVTVQGYNKTSTRLPEALFLKFAPNTQQQPTAREGSMVRQQREVMQAIRQLVADTAKAASNVEEVKPKLAKLLRQLQQTSPPADENAGGWCMNKLEQWLSPWPIPWGGSTRLHAVSEAGVAYVPALDVAPSGGSDWSDGAVVGRAITSTEPDQCWKAMQNASKSLQVRSFDSAVVSLGELTTLPIPTTDAPDFSQGAAFVLHDNAWATNYMAFFGSPMPAGGPQEDDFQWRFQLLDWP
jgi:hypothetical protein